MSDLPSFEGDISTILPRIEQLETLRLTRTNLEAQLTEVKSAIEVEEDAVFKLMELANVQSIRFGGKLFFRRVDVYYSVNAENREEANVWLKNNGFEELFRETINAKTLTSEIKHRKEEDPEFDVPDELVNNKTFNRISTRKA